MKYTEYIDVQHEILDDFKSHTSDFILEAKNLYSNDLFLDWLSKQIYSDGWKVLGLRYEGDTVLNEILEKHCPMLCAFLKKYDDHIYSLAYSSLNSGTEIYPHFDRKKPHNVLRCHLGLIIPEGDCLLKVNGIEKKWNEGEFLIFDDSYTHEAWNKTESHRIVLLIDLFRDKIM